MLTKAPFTFVDEVLFYKGIDSTKDPALLPMTAKRILHSIFITRMARAKMELEMGAMVFGLNGLTFSQKMTLFGLAVISALKGFVMRRY
jgi:hypothetical protein